MQIPLILLILLSQSSLLHTLITLGVTGFVVIAVFPATRSQLRRARNSFRNCVHSKHIGIFAAGGAILGMGMTLAGSVSVRCMHVHILIGDTLQVLIQYLYYTVYVIQSFYLYTYVQSYSFNYTPTHACNARATL